MKLTLDRTRKYSEIHGDVDDGRAFKQDALPFDSQGRLLPRDRMSKEEKDIITRIEQGKLTRAMPVLDPELEGDDGVRKARDAYQRALQKAQVKAAKAEARPKTEKQVVGRPDDDAADDGGDVIVDGINLSAHLRGEQKYLAPEGRRGGREKVFDRCVKPHRDQPLPGHRRGPRARGASEGRVPVTWQCPTRP